MAEFPRDPKVRRITWRDIGQRQATYRSRLDKRS